MAPSHLDILGTGVGLVTPTSRLAGLIADAYTAKMIERGHGAWEAPQVMPFGAWLSETFNHLVLAAPGSLVGKALLSVEQERALWEQIVRERDDSDAEVIEPVAALAMGAWSSIHLWDIPMSAIEAHPRSQDVRAFAQWAKRFVRRCQDLGVLDQHRFAMWLRECSDADAGYLPAFSFFGYARMPPLLRAIEQNLVAAMPVADTVARKHSAPVKIREYNHSELEISTMMAWAAEKKQSRPDDIVCVAIAGASRVDPELERQLRRGYTVAIGADKPLREANLSYASSASFAELAVIDAAMLILDWRAVRPWDEITRLLLSPYFGAADSEHEQRALLDLQLRTAGATETSISSVLEAAQAQHTACPQLVTRVAKLQSIFAKSPRREHMQAWVAFAEQVLSAAGWPGDGELNETEQRAVDVWARIMDVVASLNVVLPTCSWRSALSKWRAVLRTRPFVPAITVNPVQIVTLEEAAYITPDALWVANLHDATWPEPLETNPLLPYVLQRRCLVPGADPVRELDHARDILTRIQARHPDAIWSYALAAGETQRRRLLDSVCEPQPVAALSSWQRHDEVMFETIDDTHATSLSATADLAGGVALFTDQSACPARALARHRLKARAPKDASPGFDAMQRGTLIHALMAAFWAGLKSSEALVATEENVLNEILHRCAKDALAGFRGRHRLPEAFLRIERERLAALAREWLLQELERPAFEVIACEQAAAASIGSYSIRTRIDRIDRLAGGEVIIIDYKTGEALASSWEGPRPDQPQLPLYASCSLEHATHGIAFARIKKGSSKFIDEPAGIMTNSLDCNGASAWQVRLDDWRAALGDLAQELALGYAPADPKHGSTTCRHCDLHSFCRIHDLDLEDSRVRDDAK